VSVYQRYGSTSWRVNETYIRVGGAWKYLFRAVDKHDMLIDFMLLERRNTRAVHHFLSKAAATMRNWPPSSITTDKCPSYPEAIARLKRDGQFLADTKHRTSNYLNNIIEADHGALKQVIKPTGASGR
jgi:IS6 family transposase